MTTAKKQFYADPDTKPAVLTPDFVGVPRELVGQTRWVLWKLEKRDGKWTKVPYQPTGTPASSTDRKTWRAFDTVKGAYLRGGFDGIGFVLGDGWAGIDLDDVRDPATGAISAPWAADLMAGCPLYFDVSPSGTGVKLIGKGKWAGKWHKRPHPSGVGEIEVYDGGRYFTVTGRPAHEFVGVGSIQNTLDALADLFDAPKAERPPPGPHAGPGLPDDDELLRKAFAAKNGAAVFRLWNGDTSGHGGDDSAADLALCSHLAFWTGPDPERIDRLFRRSGLMRKKWDEKRGATTYGARTIAEALDGKSEFYTPRGGPEATFTGGAPREQAATTPEAKRPEWIDPLAPEALHGLMGRIIAAVGPATEADPVAIVVQTMAMFGNVVGRSAHFKVEADRHFTNMFALIVGSTGDGRKGTSHGRVLDLFAGLDDDWVKLRNVSGISSSEGLLWSVRDPIEKNERVKDRGQPARFEKVVADEGEADKRLMVGEPEFANVLKKAERQGNTASAFLRQLWDGREVVQSLTKKDPVKATGAHVSLIGHITAEELHRYLTATETANGFINRFVVALVRRSKFLPDGGAMDSDTLAGLRAEIARAAGFAQTAGEVRRHEDARRLWHAVYPILSGPRTGLVGAVAARAAPHVLRLSLLYAMLDCSTVIRPVHLMAGIALWDYCERSANFLFGDRTGNPLADEIRELLKTAPNGLTRTELIAALGRHQYGDRLTAGLLALEGAGLARREAIKDTGGRPGERWYATTATTVESPLMATARRVFAECRSRDISDESDQSTPFHRFRRLCRNAADSCETSRSGPAESPPADWQAELLALLTELGPTWTPTAEVLTRLNDRLPGPAPHNADATKFLDKKFAAGEVERSGETPRCRLWRIAQ